MILFNAHEVKFGKFPNNEVNLLRRQLKRSHESMLNVVTLKYEDDLDLFRLLLVRKEINFECILRILYFPYSRMDRDNGTYAFTLKTVAEFINSMNWTKVYVYEPHSDVTPALLNNCEVISLIPRLLEHVELSSDYQVFYPDAGAQKRYSGETESSFTLSVWRSQNELVGFKKREFQTGKILESHVLGERERDTVVIIDDLCSKGGTFLLAAQKLREMGFKKIILVVGHCEYTVFNGELLTSDLIDAVYTSDSILSTVVNKQYAKLHVIPITFDSLHY